MKTMALAVVAASAAALIAADLPRPSPDLTIHLNGGGQVSVSQYRGKVLAVCFILTTCPHCQKTIGYLIKAQNDFGPRGFQVLAAAIEGGADQAVPGFIQTFHPTFPVGFSGVRTAMDYMQHPPFLNPHMPLLAFLDRQGVIQAQYEGDDPKFFSDDQEQNIRKQVEDLLKSPATGSKTSGKKTAPKKQG